jgi:hypothetical protein
MTVLALSGLSTDATSGCDRRCTPESVARDRRGGVWATDAAPRVYRTWQMRGGVSDRRVKSMSVGLLLSSFIGTKAIDVKQSLLGSRHTHLSAKNVFWSSLCRVCWCDGHAPSTRWMRLSDGKWPLEFWRAWTRGTLWCDGRGQRVCRSRFLSSDGITAIFICGLINRSGGQPW